MAYKPIPNPTAWTQADWYVDWAAGNDKNPGTPALPVKTIAGGIVAKWGTDSPELPQTTTIHLVNSQPVGAEQVVLEPTMLGQSQLVFAGNPSVNGAAFALGAVTAKNRATNTLLQIAGFAGKTPGQLVINPARGNSRCMILAVSGGGVATLTQPLEPVTPGVTTAYFATPAERDDWALGDVVQVYDTTTVNLIDIAAHGTETNPAYTAGAAVWFQGLHIPDPSGTVGTDCFCPEFEGGYVLFSDCFVEMFGQMQPTTFLNSCINTMFANGGQFEETYFAGGTITGTYGGFFQHQNWMDGDFILDTPSSGTGLIYAGFVAISAAGAMILHPGTSMEVRTNQYPAATGGVLYGAGSLSLQANSSFVRRNPTPNWVTCLRVATLSMAGGAAGASGYIGGGLFTDGVAITPANMDVYGGLQVLPTGARFAQDL